MVVGWAWSLAGIFAPGLAAAAEEPCTRWLPILAAVFAPELTRKAIFQALRHRRCYATTDSRIILRCRLNQKDMGQEVVVEDPETARRIRVQVTGTERIERAEIVKNGAVLNRHYPASDDLDWSLTDTSPARSGDYYSLRVIQEDGNRAWSSPIWIKIGLQQEE